MCIIVLHINIESPVHKCTETNTNKNHVTASMKTKVARKQHRDLSYSNWLVVTVHLFSLYLSLSLGFQNFFR